MNPNIRRGREDFIGLIYYQVGLQNTYYLVAKLMFGLCFAYCTNFVPDEYWQSTEVAYQMAFGKGHLTWEWMIGIRSTLVPVLIAIIYKLGSFVGLSNLPLFLVRFIYLSITIGAVIFCIMWQAYSNFNFFVVIRSSISSRYVVSQGFNALLSILRSPNGN